MKPKIYLESTIPSYLTGRTSRDIIVLGHQQVTLLWWERDRKLFDLFISEAVIAEIQAGDRSTAARRLELLSDIPILKTTDEVEKLTASYMKKLGYTKGMIPDVTHISFAVANRMDYLLTWNCKHIANEFVRRKLLALNDTLGLATPMVCTPDELLRRAK